MRCFCQQSLSPVCMSAALLLAEAQRGLAHFTAKTQFCLGKRSLTLSALRSQCLSGRKVVLSWPRWAQGGYATRSRPRGRASLPMFSVGCGEDGRARGPVLGLDSLPVVWGEGRGGCLLAPPEKLLGSTTSPRTTGMSEAPLPTFSLCLFCPSFLFTPDHLIPQQL